MEMRYGVAIIVGFSMINVHAMQQSEAPSCLLRIYNNTMVPIEVQTCSACVAPSGRPDTRARLKSGWQKLLPAYCAKSKFFFPYSAELYPPVTIRARLKTDHHDMRSMRFVLHKEPGYNNRILVSIVNGNLALNACDVAKEE
jgi:hypothetical protein